MQKPNTIDDFFKKTTKTPTCWIWTGSLFLKYFNKPIELHAKQENKIAQEEITVFAGESVVYARVL